MKKTQFIDFIHSCDKEPSVISQKTISVKAGKEIWINSSEWNGEEERKRERKKGLRGEREKKKASSRTPTWDV